MNMKKLTIASAATLAGATLLSGCGQSAQTSDISIDALTEDIKGKKLTVMIWGGNPAEKEGIEEMKAGFEKETGATVELQIIADAYPDQMQARITSGTLADVNYIDSSQAEKQAKNFATLDELVANKDDFYPQFLKAFTNSEGKLYAVPKDASTLAFYVNKDMIEKAGFKMEDVPTTMEELVPWTKTLQTKLGSGEIAMTVNTSIARHLGYMEAAADTEVLSRDGKMTISEQPKAVEYLDAYADAYKAGAIKTAKDLGQEWEGPAFGNGKTAMIIEGNWVAGENEKHANLTNYEVRELPTMNNKKTTMAYTVGWAVSKNTPNQAAAVQWLDYATNKGLKAWCEKAGVFPARKSVLDEMGVKENPKFAAHAKGIEYATIWERGKYASSADTEFGKQFTNLLNGKGTAQENMKTAEESLAKAIQ